MKSLRESIKNFLKKLKQVLRQLAGKDLPKAVVEIPHVADLGRAEDFAEKKRRLYIPKHFKPGQQAIAKGYGKFMKHGKQLPSYRKSTKARVQPEED